MKTLVIDSATEACSVALFADKTLVAGDYRILGRGHAEQLVPMIAALPGQGQADRIAVAIGPGSFTGVRVGIAAARALAFAWGAELVGYPTLSLLAAMAQRDHPGPITVCTTGGHGEWFVQNFGTDGAPIDDLVSLPPEQAARGAASDVIAGSQAEAMVALRSRGRAIPIWPDARTFSLLAPSVLTADAAPLYGRAPDARHPGAK